MVMVVLNVTVALPEGRLTVLKDEIDLGSFESTEVREGGVTIRNDGDAPLVIVRVSTDCGCTVPRYPHDEILPGDTATVSVRFDGKGRTPGNFRKVVRISSQSLDSTATTQRSLLFVKGKILRPLRK